MCKVTLILSSALIPMSVVYTETYNQELHVAFSGWSTSLTNLFF